MTDCINKSKDCIKTIRDPNGLYKCDWCNRKSYKHYKSYYKHAEICLIEHKNKIVNAERLDNFLETTSNSSTDSKKRKIKLTISKSRKLITQNKQLIIQQQNEGRDARTIIRERLKKTEDELDLLRNEKSSLEQNVKLMTAKFNTLNSKNIELLQMIENFSIEFLKTREYEF